MKKRNLVIIINIVVYNYLIIVYDHPTRTSILEKRITKPIDNNYNTLRWKTATMEHSLDYKEIDIEEEEDYYEDEIM